MKKLLLALLVVFSSVAHSACLPAANIRDLLVTKFNEGQEIIRRSKLEGVTWQLASFYKSIPEGTFQYGSTCAPTTTFYTSLSGATSGEQLLVTLAAPTGDMKWAFYSNDMMMELVKYLHNGLASRGIRCVISDTVAGKEKIICRNSAGAGKVAYSCFVKNLATESSYCLSL